MSTFYMHLESPIGPLLVAGSAEALTHIGFARNGAPEPPREGWIEDASPFREVERQLQEYFAGTRHRFHLPLAAEGTDFQRRVWRALEEIPYGVTWSYGELARHLGDPHAVRAVGRANGANPLPIVVPCHRVIGADGSLTGFGGGLDAKRFLLELEGALRAPGPLFA